MMQTKFLRSFIAVAETKNVTLASQIVHLSQSTVSEQIKAIETELGVSLFNRTRKGLKLTTAGESLLPIASQMVFLEDKARGLKASQTVNCVKVGSLDTLSTFFIPELIRHAKKAGADSNFIIKSASSSELHKSLINEEIDVCFRFGSMSDNEGISETVIGFEDIILAAPRSAKLPSVMNIMDLQSLDFLVTPIGCIYRKQFDETVRNIPKKPRIVGEFSSIWVMLNCVQQGMGCALVPRLAMREIRDLQNISVLGLSERIPIIMAKARNKDSLSFYTELDSLAREVFSSLKPDAVHRQHG